MAYLRTLFRNKSYIIYINRVTVINILIITWMR